jgi:hypothetical protein
MALWQAVCPDTQLTDRVTPQWKQIGFQVRPPCSAVVVGFGKSFLLAHVVARCSLIVSPLISQGNDPATDFRGMGLLGLTTILYFARHHGDTLSALLKQGRSYPWASTGINLTQMLFKSLKLDGTPLSCVYVVCVVCVCGCVCRVVLTRWVTRGAHTSR